MQHPSAPEKDGEGRSSKREAEGWQLFIGSLCLMDALEQGQGSWAQLPGRPNSSSYFLLLTASHTLVLVVLQIGPG